MELFVIVMVHGNSLMLIGQDYPALRTPSTQHFWQISKQGSFGSRITRQLMSIVPPFKLFWTKQDIRVWTIYLLTQRALNLKFSRPFRSRNTVLKLCKWRHTSQ